MRRLLALIIFLSLPVANHAAPCTIDYNNVHQRIDGFGASSAWRTQWTTPQAEMFFSTNSGTGRTLDGTTNFSFNGIGLSLLRNHIVPASTAASNAAPSTGELSIMQMAQTRGATVWSSPWTPPNGFKDNGAQDGGNYLGIGNNATNLAYASQLASYVAVMKEVYGIKLYALSVQNEPDYDATNYEACIWTGTQIHDFVTNLYAALAARGVASVKIIIPECSTWSANPGLFTPTLADPNAAAEVGIVADHDYVPNNVVGDTTTPAVLPVSGQAVWETEVSQINGGYDGSMNNAIYWAGRIHLYLTAAQVNAWHYWWLISDNADNEGLTDANGMPAKRMYVLGNFSRFVRPNFYRIDTVAAGPAQISAYKDSASAAFAIVAVNPATSNVTQIFNLANFTAEGALTPWITSASVSLAAQPAIAVTNSSFTYTLPAQSVVTFSGNADLAPTNIELSNASIAEDMPIGSVVGNLSSTSPISGNSFTYNLVSGTGGNDNVDFVITNQTLATAAVFDYQVQNSFHIRIRSTDQNGLWCEQTFVVTGTFNSQARRIVSASATTAGYLTLTFAGIPGSSCQILAATNLTPPVQWKAVTNNLTGGTNFTLPANGSWTNTDFNAPNLPAQFYQIVELPQ